MSQSDNVTRLKL